MEKHFHRFIQETAIHGNAFIWNVLKWILRNALRFAKGLEWMEWGEDRECELLGAIR